MEVMHGIPTMRCLVGKVKQLGMAVSRKARMEVSYGSFLSGTKVNKPGQLRQCMLVKALRSQDLEEKEQA